MLLDFIGQCFVKDLMTWIFLVWFDISLEIVCNSVDLKWMYICKRLFLLANRSDNFAMCYVNQPIFVSQLFNRTFHLKLLELENSIVNFQQKNIECYMITSRHKIRICGTVFTVARDNAFICKHKNTQ